MSGQGDAQAALGWVIVGPGDYGSEVVGGVIFASKEDADGSFFRNRSTSLCAVVPAAEYDRLRAASEALASSSVQWGVESKSDTEWDGIEAGASIGTRAHAEQAIRHYYQGTEARVVSRRVTPWEPAGTDAGLDLAERADAYAESDALAYGYREPATPEASTP